MKSKRLSYFFYFIIAVSLIVMASGCKAPSSNASELKLGENIPESEPVTSLADIIKNPFKYNGKKIVMNGFVSGQCASLCEFVFKEGIHAATIYPQGFKFPKLELGKNVTVYSLVTSGEERIVFSAVGLEMK